MRKVAFVDERALARDFHTGDIVQRTGLRDLFLAPYYGRVLYSDYECGFVMVHWPWGVDQESPAELVIVNNDDVLPPLDVDQTYSTWEGARHGLYGDDQDQGHPGLAARVASKYERQTIPIWREACRYIHSGADEIQTFQNVYRKFQDDFSADAVRLTVSNLFNFGRRLAIYWRSTNRQYKVTKREKSSGSLYCPRCGSPLKPRIYRQGKKVLQCRMCGFSIHPADLLV